MNRKQQIITGYFGIAISLTFILSFSIIFIHLIPSFFKKEIIILMYNSQGIPGRNFIKYIAYFFTGILIIFFNIALIKNTNNSSTNLIGKIFLLLSGLIYSSLGIIDKNEDILTNLNLFQYSAVLPFGILGLFFLCFEFEKISKSKKTKKGLILITLYLITECFVNIIFIINNLTYNFIITKLSWLIYFLSFGYIGLCLLLKR